MSLLQLLFFFIVLPIIYTMLAIILLAAIGSTIKQIRWAEYQARLSYEQSKLKAGQQMAERLRSDLAEVQ